MTRTGGIRGWLIPGAIIALIHGAFALFLVFQALADEELLADDVNVVVMIMFLETALFGGIAAILFVARSVIRRVADERNELAAKQEKYAGGIPPGTRTGGIRGWLITAAVIALIHVAIALYLVSRMLPMWFLETALFGGIAAISFVARSVIRRVADERNELAAKQEKYAGGIPPGD